MAEFRDDNTSNTQTTLLVRQDGSGDVLNLSTGSNEVLTVNDQGQLGVGTTTPNEKITIEGAISLDEIAYTPAAVSGYGKIYVKSSDSKLYFKNDTGTEYDLLAAAASGAPTDASYVVLSANGTLTAERVIVAGDGIALVDSGSGSNLTLSQSVNLADFAFSAGHLNLAPHVMMTASSDSGTAIASSHTLTFTGGEAIDTSATGGTVTISAEDASTSNKGVASFTSADFTVSSGHISLDDNIVKQVGTDSGTATGASHKIDIVGGTNVTVSATGDTVTITSTATAIDEGGFFESTTGGSIFTTGAVAFVGAQSSPSAPDAPSDVGNDVFFFVSGTVGSKNSSNTGSAVFGGDLLASGTIVAEVGFSGSISNLSDGRSLIAAGDNVTITTASSGQIIISSVGGGGGSGDSQFSSTTAGSIFYDRCSGFCWPSIVTPQPPTLLLM